MAANIDEKKLLKQYAKERHDMKKKDSKTTRGRK